MFAELFPTLHGLSCVDCGHGMYLEDGVAYHVDDLGESDYRRDRDHVAIPPEPETLHSLEEIANVR